MPDRKSKKIEEQNPTSCLRRSPRLLHLKNQIGAQSPKTPKLAATRRNRSDSFSTPITEFKKSGHGVLGNGGEKETKPNSEESRNGCRKPARTERGANFSSPDLEKRHVTEKRQTRSSVGGCRIVKDSENSGEGSRRSGKRDRGANVDKRDEVQETVIEKRVTRSSVRGDRVVIYEISDSDSEEDSSEVILSNEQKSKVGVDYAKKNTDKFEKGVTRSSSKIDPKTARNEANTTQKKGVISDKIEPEGDDEVSKIDTSRKDDKDFGNMMRNGEQNCTRKAQIGEKRKRDVVEEECRTAQGWSNDQELALQRAYFTAKPTPQFWKKVARMVPGKSANECFERIHSDHPTPPPQSRTRSRAKQKEPSPLSFSASNLLSPVQMKSKGLGTRRKTVLAQKTVRKILQKQQKEDEDYNADLFAVLEPTVNPSTLGFEESTFVSPPPKKASPFFTACRQMSSSSQRKHRSRINSSQKTAFASPLVLKQIKNRALHEKYIDQLHSREVKRKAAALRNSRNLKNQIDEGVNDLKQNLVKAAKDALVSDAHDAISKLRSLQSRTDEDDGDEEDEDEDEDEDGL